MTALGDSLAPVACCTASALEPFWHGLGGTAIVRRFEAGSALQLINDLNTCKLPHADGASGIRAYRFGPDAALTRDYVIGCLPRLFTRKHTKVRRVSRGCSRRVPDTDFSIDGVFRCNNNDCLKQSLPPSARSIILANLILYSSSPPSSQIRLILRIRLPWPTRPCLLPRQRQQHRHPHGVDSSKLREPLLKGTAPSQLNP